MVSFRWGFECCNQLSVFSVDKLPSTMPGFTCKHKFWLWLWDHANTELGWIAFIGRWDINVWIFFQSLRSSCCTRLVRRYIELRLGQKQIWTSLSTTWTTSRPSIMTTRITALTGLMPTRMSYRSVLMHITVLASYSWLIDWLIFLFILEAAVYNTCSYQ